MADNPQGGVETKKKEKTKKGNFIYRDTMALVDGKFVVCCFGRQTVIKSIGYNQTSIFYISMSSPSSPFQSIFVNALTFKLVISSISLVHFSMKSKAQKRRTGPFDQICHTNSSPPPFPLPSVFLVSPAT